MTVFWNWNNIGLHKHKIIPRSVTICHFKKYMIFDKSLFDKSDHQETELVAHCKYFKYTVECKLNLAKLNIYLTAITKIVKYDATIC